MGAILKKVCPRCKTGEIFAGWFTMNPVCPVCGMNFHRESGYYTGAMFINWFFAVFIIAPVWVTLMLNHSPFWQIMLATITLLVLFAPLFFQYSRVIWLYIDFIFFHPE